MATVLFNSSPDILGRSQLRQQLRHQRRQLTFYQQKQASRALIQRLQKQSFFKQAQKIGIYDAMDGELDITALIQQAHKSYYLPVLRRFPKQRLAFVRITSWHRLAKHRYGMKEPQYRPRLMIDDLDIVLMPLVGFDNAGNRLGMGGGYYDRSLAYQKKTTLVKVGIAHDCQEVGSLANMAWDIPLDVIVTPSRLLIT
ncbi:5-formyltetrahydrofolate cyclo-ligase [Agitococcus lubricus]|uniref:5-formyltetrahydrofolate cyclo-ligase n=1 Tax=Agitococcus lubricus TaxID=1077255 RepID=A0A2T5IZN4_9GAMM|nr:5-formyltetrahydrofolate cyclo-ligase [Agitococcus lubricus]PTQ89541.1 5-formyltetrahydrofolate cyclo-ligase [Agitococcus lubricus]